MTKRSASWSAMATVVALLGACSGGGGSGGVPGTSGDFLVMRTTPPNNGRLFLNEEIRIDFTNEIDIGSADLNTMAFQVFDLNGNALSEAAAGTFSIGTAAGDDEPGRQLVFTPRFPTDNAYSNGGFKPAREYIVQLVGGNTHNQTVLRDRQGRALAQPLSFRFQTVSGTTPAQLFSDTLPGGPKKVSFEVTPSDPDGVALNKFGLEGVEVRLGFDQPLNPADTNVPVNVSPDPLLRDSTFQGQIFLEYDEPGNPNLWIPATVDLEVNRREGSILVMRPIGILPNNAIVRVIVERTVQDMSGASNVSDGAYERVFGTFTTKAAFEPQYDAIVENFDSESSIDPQAAFLEPLASQRNGVLSGSFAFQGGEERLTYRSRQRDVILDTNFTQIAPENGAPMNVRGGIFEFARVEIPEGVTVRGVGTNPMVWLVTGDFIVDGILSVNGGDGARVDTLNSANFPTPGGIGVCGGGNGGRGSPVTVDRSLTGEAGYGPRQKPNGGGEPGKLSCVASCNRGSAGGGGSMSVEGDPWYPLSRATVTGWPQIDGRGGQGCLSNRTLLGGLPGPTVFTDLREDNDFWGSGVDVFQGIRITGELLAPTGGSGGGGGGDRSTRCNTGDPVGFISDNKGGGGGGGAGVLIVQALGTIRIGPRGLISANGGNGGGGEQAGANNEGGGGGGGSGGMIVLMAGQGFEIFVHGNELAAPPKSTYGEADFNFAISADGGIGTQGVFNGAEIRSKYPIGSSSWNAKPTGGFGGLGLVQMLVPPGDDQTDQTGNRLDDNVRFLYRDAQGVVQEVSPDRKKALLAWRGWPDAAGQRVDDNGDPIVLRAGLPLVPNPSGEGDIRPSPIMLPSPFGTTSRARSRWIDLGAAVRERRDQAPGAGDPRTVVAAAGTEPWPDFGDPTLGFAGTSIRQSDAGYVKYDDTSGRIMVPVVRPGGVEFFDVADVDTSVDFQGQPAYRIDLAPGSDLGPVADRYAQYRLDPFDAAGEPLLTAGSAMDFRILGHDQTTLFIAPDGNLAVAELARVRILAKFFDVKTLGQDGLGEVRTITAVEQAPVSNVRIGFAFHTEPELGFGTARWPNGTNQNEAQFEFDLRNPAFLAWLQANRPRYVQWDVLFNTRFDPSLPANYSGQPLSAELPIQTLDYLVLPYRF